MHEIIFKKKNNNNKPLKLFQPLFYAKKKKPFSGNQSSRKRRERGRQEEWPQVDRTTKTDIFSLFCQDGVPIRPALQCLSVWEAGRGVGFIESWS